MSKCAMKNGIGGFGLVEVMVGLVIGLIAILLIGQVTATFEGQKRSSTGGTDAQTNGIVALSTLTHEITMAGTGLVVPGLGTAGGNLLCPLGTWIYNNGSVVSQPSDANKGILAPVRIVDGGAAASDSIVVVRSDAELGQLAMNVRKFDTSVSPPVVTVDAWPDSNALPTPDTPKEGQLFLIGKSNGTKVCTLFQVSGANHATAGAAWNLNFATSYPYNPTTPPVTTYGDGDVIVNMGMSYTTAQGGNLTVPQSGFVYRRYGVQCGKLAAVDPSQTTGSFTCTNTSPLVDEIVYLKAQYGVAADGSQNVTNWYNAGNWALTSAANVTKIKAIRIAIVARSPQFEKSAVSPASITLWDNTGFIGADAAPVFTVPDQQYRYKVFTTVVPIKTVIWGKL
jgi:type IV pilus assembly protein PilW